jgi:glyoxylase-like metal-dependent hydrolase (beta-lactamase superfamily II)
MRTMHRRLFVMLLVSFSVACARPTPERQIAEDAAAALGGSERVLAVKTLTLDGRGTQRNLGQDVTPDATGQTFTVSSYHREVDLAAGRGRIEITRTPNFMYFRGPAAQRQSIDEKRIDTYHHPITAVRAALDAGAALSNPRTVGGERVIAVKTADGSAFTLAIDATTALPTRVVSMTDHAVLGDVAIETGFANYLDVAGLKLPARVTVKTDKFTTAEFQIDKQAIDGAVSLAALSPNQPQAPPPVAVTAEEVAKGVWLLAGQSHHSVLVEFADHLVLVEAPSEARTLAVIAKARELRPDKPLTHLVNSHHHFDHSGGVRAAVSEGLTVITHKANATLYNDLVARSRTISPDALTKNPKPLRLEPVDEHLVHKDDVMEMQLYPITGNPHGDTMLMAYLPRERLLIEADAYSPGGNYHPYAPSLLENIKRRNLRVERIVPIHGTVVPLSELVKAVHPTPTN